ncbi:hypothetical protein Fot_22233 [Forsythia ovata]|uniref:Uncharacterized protein n=1 Tax=Forsythia ovata TaxID=205694 RepID=A0ABD1UX54_9LAMI
MGNMEDNISAIRRDMNMRTIFTNVVKVACCVVVSDIRTAMKLISGHCAVVRRRLRAPNVPNVELFSNSIPTTMHQNGQMNLRLYAVLDKMSGRCKIEEREIDSKISDPHGPKWNRASDRSLGNDDLAAMEVAGFRAPKSPSQ